MSIIVTDAGFAADDKTDLAVTAVAELGPEADPETLRDRLPDLELVRIGFPSFADGRGFTLARRLRLMGYRGHLRAVGQVISDQYAMARRAGFDDVEISDELARRQPEDEWIFRAAWQSHDYQARLRG